MHAQDLFVNNSGNRETVETISESLPQLDVVASLALIVESIDSIDGGTFVVSSQEEEVLRILDLVSQEQANSLKGLLASVHIIAEEEVIGVGWETSVLEQSQQIVVLTVNITADLNGSFQLE